MPRAANEWRSLNGLHMRKLGQAEGWVLAKYRGAARAFAVDQRTWETYALCDHLGKLLAPGAEASGCDRND